MVNWRFLTFSHNFLQSQSNKYDVAHQAKLEWNTYQLSEKLIPKFRLPTSSTYISNTQYDGYTLRFRQNIIPIFAFFWHFFSPITHLIEMALIVILVPKGGSIVASSLLPPVVCKQLSIWERDFRAITVYFLDLQGNLTNGHQILQDTLGFVTSFSTFWFAELTRRGVALEMIPALKDHEYHQKKCGSKCQKTSSSPIWMDFSSLHSQFSLHLQIPTWLKKPSWTQAD